MEKTSASDDFAIQLTNKSRVWFWQIWGYIQAGNDEFLKSSFAKLLSTSEFEHPNDTDKHVRARGI